MKQITKEKVSTYTVYQASDGTEFEDKAECKKYEESAAGVIKTRLKEFTRKQITENDLYGIGSEEYEYVILTPTINEHYNTILQYYNLINTASCYEENRTKLINAIKNNPEILVFGIGTAYDNYDCFYYYGTPEDHINDYYKMISK